MTSPPAAARIGWIDEAKGLGIALIVVGHVFSTREPSLFYQYLYAFHVPLFFFLAGLTLRPEPGKTPELLKKKTRTLLLPYALYALLGYAFYLAGYLVTSAAGKELDQFRYGLWAPLWGILWGNVGSGNLVNSPVWFLPALFWATLIVHELNTRVASLSARLLALSALTLAGVALAGRTELPLSGIPALLALPFLQAGVMHRHWLDRATSPDSGPAWSLLALGLFVISPLNGFSMQSEAQIGNPVLFYPFAFAGILITVRAIRQSTTQRRWLSLLGQHSLAVMVLHMLVIKSVQVVLSMGSATPFSVLASDPRWGLLVLALTSVLLIPLVWLVNRWLPFSLGKSPSPFAHA